MQFNFNKLSHIYNEALSSADKSLAFDISVGRGQFLFMMFLSSEDEDAKDNLFIYMRHIKKIEKLKTYGSHKKGDFIVYLDKENEDNFEKELQLNHSGFKQFDFEHFLNELNNSIPQTIPMQNKVNTLRMNLDVIKELSVIDEVDKNVLIGTKHLTIGSPRDKTLRKLYLYIDSTSQEIDDFINILKSCNDTVAWTSEKTGYKAITLNSLLNKRKD